MSLLDDARQLAHQTHSSIWRLGLDHCWSCGAPVQDGPGQLIRHTDACGLIAMTKIVAALEAAEQVIHRGDGHHDGEMCKSLLYGLPCSCDDLITLREALEG